MSPSISAPSGKRGHCSYTADTNQTSAASRAGREDAGVRTVVHWSSKVPLTQWEGESR